MNSVFLDESIRKVLSSPCQWKVMSTLLPPEIAPADHSVHQQWMGQYQHQNSHDEILIALQGNGVYGIQEKCYPCLPGHVFLLGQQEFHDTRYPPFASDMTHLWLHLLDGSAYALIQKISRNAKPQILCRVDLYEDSAALRMLIQAWRNLRSTGDAMTPFHRAQLSSALYLVIVEIVERSQFDPEEDDTFSKRVIRRITDHVALNGELSANIDDLALMAGYSKYHFARLFRKHTGQTVHHFLDGCRLSRAIEMLAKGHRQKEVAAALGFKHESSFSRWHKMHLKITSRSNKKKGRSATPTRARMQPSRK